MNFSRIPKVLPLRLALQFMNFTYLLLGKTFSLVKTAQITSVGDPSVASPPLCWGSSWGCIACNCSASQEPCICRACWARLAYTRSPAKLSPSKPLGRAALQELPLPPAQIQQLPKFKHRCWSSVTGLLHCS